MSPIQRKIFRGMLVGALITTSLIVVGVLANPFEAPKAPTFAQRLDVAATAVMLLALCLAVAIGRLARHRFFSLEDIDGAGLCQDSGQAMLLQSLLQNTLEQSVLASLVYSAWAVTMPGSTLSVIPLAAIAFAIGRVLFFRGYAKGASARAIGFTLAFYPSLAMLLCNGAYLIWGRFAGIA